MYTAMYKIGKFVHYTAHPGNLMVQCETPQWKAEFTLSRLTVNYICHWGVGPGCHRKNRTPRTVKHYVSELIISSIQMLNRIDALLLGSEVPAIFRKLCPRNTAHGPCTIQFLPYGNTREWNTWGLSFIPQLIYKFLGSVGPRDESTPWAFLFSGNLTILLDCFGVGKCPENQYPLIAMHLGNTVDFPECF